MSAHALHVFIDTNVLLTFYAFATDDIEQLNKLSGVIKTGKLKLYISQQVADEFGRNREGKLAKSIEDFLAVGSKALPRFMADYDEAEKFRGLQTELDKVRNSLVQRAKQDTEGITLAVDQLVGSLFTEAGITPISQDIVDKAKLRRDLGNPPGKGTSLGDQINWEFLLEVVPENTCLHILSADGDFKSASKNGKPHHFLTHEWKNRNGGELILHKELRPFIKAHFKTIELEIDKEKDQAIGDLVNSGNFQMTHQAVAQLNSFFDALTSADADQLVKGGMSNSQVVWIAEDEDVNKFFQKLLSKFKGDMEGPLLDEACMLFGVAPF